MPGRGIRPPFVHWIARKVRAWADAVLSETDPRFDDSGLSAQDQALAHWVEKVRRAAPELLRGTVAEATPKRRDSPGEAAEPAPTRVSDTPPPDVTSPAISAWERDSKVPTSGSARPMVGPAPRAVRDRAMLAFLQGHESPPSAHPSSDRPAARYARSATIEELASTRPIQAAAPAPPTEMLRKKPAPALEEPPPQPSLPRAPPAAATSPKEARAPRARSDGPDGSLERVSGIAPQPQPPPLARAALVDRHRPVPPGVAAVRRIEESSGSARIAAPSRRSEDRADRVRRPSIEPGPGFATRTWTEPVSVFRAQGEIFEKAASAVDGQWPDLPPLQEPAEQDVEPLLRAIERRARLRREQEGI